LSVQLESRHFFRTGDTVRDPEGLEGVVVDFRALYAVVAWSDGRSQEVEQFDPTILVVERARTA
jgi:hypothetical protein